MGIPIIKATYQLSCALTPQDAMQRVAQLLTDEGVEYTKRDLSIASTSTPFALFSFQSRMYTRKNWFGVNPFACISAVDVDFDDDDRGGLTVTIRVNRTRSVLWWLFYVAFGAIAAISLMPMPLGVIFFVGWSLAAWLANVHFFGGYLIRSEMRKALRT